MLALSVIFIVSCAGELLNRFIPLPIPASIYGLVLMLLLLQLRVVKLEAIKPTADWFIDFMPAIFVVPAVGLLVMFGEFRQMLLPLLVIMVFSTILVMAATGHAAQGVIRLQGRRRSRGGTRR